MATMAVRMAAASHEEASAIDTIVLAFSSDPVARWCWADPRLYLSAMPTFTRAFAGVPSCTRPHSAPMISQGPRCGFRPA